MESQPQTPSIRLESTFRRRRQTLASFLPSSKSNCTYRTVFSPSLSSSESPPLCSSSSSSSLSQQAVSASDSRCASPSGLMGGARGGGEARPYLAGPSGTAALILAKPLRVISGAAERSAMLDGYERSVPTTEAAVLAELLEPAVTDAEEGERHEVALRLGLLALPRDGYMSSVSMSDASLLEPKDKPPKVSVKRTPPPASLLSSPPLTEVHSCPVYLG